MKDKAFVEAIREELMKDPFFRLALGDVAKVAKNSLDDKAWEAIKALRADLASIMRRGFEGVIDGRID